MLYEPEVRTGDAALAAAQEGGQDEEESSNVEIRIAPQHENSGWFLINIFSLLLHHLQSNAKFSYE